MGFDRYFTNNSSGEILALFNNDLMGASNGISTSLPKIASNIFTVVFTGYYLATDNWKLAIVSAAVLPLWKISSDMISKRSKEAQHRAHDIKVPFENYL
jgi:ABC-type multidrug transport system fused ATPase/permease subunit